MRTFAEQAAKVEVVASELERIAYRLRQGAIAPESAIKQLGEIQDEIRNEL